MTTETPLPVLELLPAVDVADGQAVRLVQGEAGTETGYGDPLSAALDWQRGGAEWIHLVDLDAAFGRGLQRRPARRGASASARASRSSCPAASATTPRSSARSARAADAGQPRHRRPGEPGVDRPGDRRVRRPDRRRAWTCAARRSPARGWTKDGGDLWEVLARLEDAGCARYVVTDVTKDGTLQRPERRAAAQMCARPARPSSRPAGCSSLEDLACSGRSCRSASRARSSARRSTPARSRCPRPSTSPAAASRPQHGAPARGRQRS